MSPLQMRSLVLGLVGGAGLTLLAGAAVAPDARNVIGRYELRATSSDTGSTAFIVDTVSGEVYIVGAHNSGHVIKPEWGK